MTNTPTKNSNLKPFGNLVNLQSIFKNKRNGNINYIQLAEKFKLKFTTNQIM